MLTTNLAIYEDERTSLHIQGFSASFLQLFLPPDCSVDTAFGLPLTMHMRNDFWRRCCLLIVVQSVFQLFLLCPYMLLVIFHTQSIVSEHGFFLLCTCWSVYLLLQGLPSTFKAPLLPLQAALS